MALLKDFFLKILWGVTFSDFVGANFVGYCGKERYRIFVRGNIARFLDFLQEFC